MTTRAEEVKKRSQNSLAADREHILCSAIHFDDGEKHIHQPKNIETGFVVCGLRHHNCYGVLYALGIVRNGKYTLRKGIEEVQGFLTSQDRFVDRMVAAQIARDANQIEYTKRLRILMSEDLWKADIMES